MTVIDGLLQSIVDRRHGTPTNVVPDQRRLVRRGCCRQLWAGNLCNLMLQNGLPRNGHASVIGPRPPRGVTAA